MTTQIMIVINIFTLIINIAFLSESVREGKGKNIVIHTSLAALAAWILIYEYVPAYWGLIP